MSTYQLRKRDKSKFESFIEHSKPFIHYEVTTLIRHLFILEMGEAITKRTKMEAEKRMEKIKKLWSNDPKLFKERVLIGR